jgi:hypothetical protein
MNRPDVYFKTSAILLEAYKNETLFHTNWESCACANIIAANMGYSLRIFFYKRGCVGAFWRYKKGVVESRSWGKLLQPGTVLYRIFLRLVWGKAKYRLEKKHLSCTGYTRKELRMIARQFDHKQDLGDSTAYVLDALKRVLERLKKIHKVNHFDIQATYRKQFLEELNQLKVLKQSYDRVQDFYESERKNQQEIFEKTGVMFGEIIPNYLFTKKETKPIETKAREVYDLID